MQIGTKVSGNWRAPSWAAATTVATPAAGQGYSDANIGRTSSGRLILTSFLNDATSFLGVTYQSSDDDCATWGGPSGTLHPYTERQCTSGKVVQHSGGALIMPVYGWNTGDSDYRNGVYRSTNNGLGWGSVVGIAAQNSGYSEMTIVEAPGGVLHGFVRSSANPGPIYHTTSADAGLTWTALASLGFNVTPGRPAPLLLPSGVWVLFYRSVTSSRAAWRWSADLVTWSAEQIYSASVYGYAALVNLDASSGAVVTSLEVSGTDARLFYNQITLI